MIRTLSTSALKERHYEDNRLGIHAQRGDDGQVDAGAPPSPARWCRSSDDLPAGDDPLPTAVAKYGSAYGVNTIAVGAGPLTVSVSFKPGYIADAHSLFKLLAKKASSESSPELTSST